MPSILQQGYGPALGYMSETGSLLGGSSPARMPGRPPLPQAQVLAPNYQGLASQYAMQDQAASSANTSAAVSGATTAAYLTYLAYAAGAFCWVAREVFGEDDPRWRVFRAWLLTQAPEWFRELYMRYGERAARFLKTHSIIKKTVRWWMQKKVNTMVRLCGVTPEWW